MQSRYTAAAFVALLAFISAAGAHTPLAEGTTAPPMSGARTLLADGPAAAPMMSMGAPAMAPSSASAPAATEGEAAPAAAPTQATPSRTPAPAGCALSYIQANSSYSKFAQILYATPSTANLSNILSDQISGITVFLPSNDAINTTLEKFGLDFDGLLKNQGLCTQIMEYHILPSPIEYSAFKEGYSFNTVLNDDGQDLRDSLRVRRSGDDIKIQSGKTLAKVGTNGAKVCEDSIFPISMMLLPRNSIQASGTPSS